MTHGVNKDYRPDLKQLVLGMSVTADGAVPLVHEIYDGNQTDDRLHPANHARLRKLLKRSDFIYVADCKLVTEDNLRKITACDGLFVSVMPRSWKEDKVFRERVRKGTVEWKHIFSRPNNRNPESKRDHYYVAAGQYVTSQGYRLLWIRSTQKAAQDAEGRQRNLGKSLAMLRELQTRLNKYTLKTRTNIDEKITTILKQHKCSDLIVYEIRRTTHKKTRPTKAGRPRVADTGSSVEQEYFTLSFHLNDARIKEEALTDGVFPLITNLKDHTPKELLEIYKYQPFLAKRHSQLKTYQEIAPAFLKQEFKG
jgi:transposase